MARYFINKGQYFETISEVTPGPNGWEDGRIEVTKRPSLDYIWQNGSWVYIQPDPEVIKAKIRESAIIPKWAFCSALRKIRLLPANEAIQAARGDWPATFQSFTSFLPEDQAADAQIKWAAVSSVQYSDPLLQALALHHTKGNQAAATALLDQLFGI